jgi:hypothetical protein
MSAGIVQSSSAIAKTVKPRRTQAAIHIGVALMIFPPYFFFKFEFELTTFPQIVLASIPNLRRPRGFGKSRPRGFGKKGVGPRLVEEGKKEVVTNHELSPPFLIRPNPSQSWFEFCEQIHVGFMLRGNAYAVKIRNWRGRITMHIPINSDLVWIYQAPDGSFFHSPRGKSIPEFSNIFPGPCRRCA